jgi:hypothetical protein
MASAQGELQAEDEPDEEGTIGDEGTMVGEGGLAHSLGRKFVKKSIPLNQGLLGGLRHVTPGMAWKSPELTPDVFAVPRRTSVPSSPKVLP